MLNNNIFDKNSGIQSILLLGAHCDDIEIGCGGTVLKLANQNPDINIHWVVFSSNDVREKEARSSADAFLAGYKATNVIVKKFKNGFFPYIGADIKTYFEELKKQVDPDVIFTHYGQDKHQDHRLISELTWNTFRNHVIFEYEIAKFDGDLASPNAFTTLSNTIANKKVELLDKYFISQKDKQWFSNDLFMALMRIRGVECNAEEGLAEGFYCRKMILG